MSIVRAEVNLVQVKGGTFGTTNIITAFVCKRKPGLQGIIVDKGVRIYSGNEIKKSKIPWPKILYNMAYTTNFGVKNLKV